MSAAILYDVRSFDFGWAVGFFEGEGSVSASLNGSGRRYLLAAVPQKDLDALERFALIVGVGKIYSPTQSGLTCSRWQARGAAWPFLEAAYPFFSSRRQGQVDVVRRLTGR
jgi:hypothetical protein